MQKETLGFQAEVKQLLNLMIHSLYSNKEIFLRELISNASDAADKLRFAALADPTLLENDPELKVHVSFDKAARTITIADNGIGMTRDEVVANLGTIARSGTREFLAALAKEQASNTQLIGQFGVGFYSSFIVADKVTVLTRKAGMEPEHGVQWESNGEGEYTLETVNKVQRGTEIILHLRSDEDEFLDDWRLRNIIQKYSDHVTLPVMMKKPAEDSKEENGSEEDMVNRATALWTLPKSEIKDSDYCDLYKHIAHDFEDPLTWSHNRVEGKQEYINLLYIPARAPFDMWQRDRRHGLKLYVKRVFIMDDADQFLPNFLRFVRGIIDSNDLPLNISREILQNNRLVDTMRSGITKRILDMLAKLAQDDKEKYATFWKEFGAVLKEGPSEDFANREQIAKLLRFATTATDSADQTVSLDDYVARMKTGQEKIYYITGESYIAAKNSPQLEIFRKKGIEVLLLSERVDEWLVASLTEYQGKPFHSVAKGDLDLGSLENEAEKEQQKQVEDDFASLVKHVQEILGERVKEVRVTHRLTDSPACLVADESDIGLQMQRILKAAGQNIPTTKPILELNPEHHLISRLKNETDDERFKEWTEILFDQSVLAEGGQLENSAQFVQRLNKLLLELAGR